LYRAAKAIRKHWGGLTLASQDAMDFLGTDLGQAVVANAATQILMRQATQAIDGIVRAFTLSQGQRQFLLSCERGQGLLAVRNNWVAFQAIASPTEHALVSSDPEFLASVEDPDTDSGWVEL
ncbi:conjugal transfer protein TraC, partial [Kutzneria sp. NPDC052558]